MKRIALLAHAVCAPKPLPVASSGAFDLHTGFLHHSSIKHHCLTILVACVLTKCTQHLSVSEKRILKLHR